MRTPHPIAAHSHSPPNPYEELAALDDGPLEDFLQVEEPAVTEGAEQEAEWAPPNHRRGSRDSGARPRRRHPSAPAGPFAGLSFAAQGRHRGTRPRRLPRPRRPLGLLYAERTAAEKVRDQLKLSAAPEVEIDGFPFVTQTPRPAAGLRAVTVPDVAADRVSLAKVSATATGRTLDGDGPTSMRGARIPRAER